MIDLEVPSSTTLRGTGRPPRRRLAPAIVGATLVAVAVVAGLLVYGTRSLAAREDWRRASGQCSEVRTHLAARRYREANDGLLAARSTLALAGSPREAMPLECLRAEAQAADIGRRFTDALAFNERAIEAMDDSSVERVSLETARAALLMKLGETTRAHQASSDALRHLTTLHETPTAELAVTHAVISNRLRRTADARRALAVAAGETLATHQLGRADLLDGRLDAARARFDRARREWSGNERANRDLLADLSRSEAELELARGRVDAAREDIDASLVLFGYPTDQSVPGLGGALSVASRIYLRSRQLERAEVFGRGALKIAERTARNPAESADVGEALLAISAVRRAKDDLPGARAFAARAVQALTNSLGVKHPLTREAIRAQRAAQ
jgi:tetratricopeptide (TPR) repeat protein